MFPFWEMVIAPLVKAARGQRVLEIGALRGETTARMFEQLGPTSELHVIDPLPQFDPAEHERAFPGRYVFHRALSLDVLPDLPPFDVALIDGDHNWYTVFHELGHLAATARAADAPLPLLMLHDVGWPYGHRDLYYEPDQIPEEHRQTWRRAGMARGYHRLLGEGGLNADLANALDGGGPRNGVMCALDDFLEGHDRPFRKVVLPLYFGLAIVVEEERLELTPEVGKVLDHLESSGGRHRLITLGEKIRLDATVHEHNTARVADRRIATQRDRYLALLKDALADRHYLENEVRLELLANAAPGGEVDAESLRDPARTLEVRFKRLAQSRHAGRGVDDGPGSTSIYTPYTAMSRAALDHLQAALVDVHERGVEGDLAECGVGRGGGGILLRACLSAYDIPDRSLWLVDRFLASSDHAVDEDENPFRARQHADLNQVRDGFDRFDLFDDRLRFVTGAYADALRDAPPGPLALLRIGIDAAFDLSTVLRRLLPRMTVGGTVIIEGVGRAGIASRLESFRDRWGIDGELEQVDWNTVAWRVTAPSDDTPEDEDDTARPVLHRVPLAPPVETDRVGLSVVVVFYDMVREAERTLRSLSRTYQRDIGDLTYEVIAIDNGSPPGRRLDPAAVESFGPEFRLVTLEDAPASPTQALNRGIAEARGEAVAVMIDGAHVLTPGVFHHALAAMATYPPAVVAIQQWYVGPGQQGDAQQAGYDQVAEDRLFQRIRWPTDGYRLFEIGHFIGDRDWFDGIIESNCLFAPRTLLEQVGGFDDSFDMPGGGYANLELFERLHSHPGVNPASVLGEGTFHQFHGGTTTNVADEAERRARITSYGEHFRETRGRGLQGLNKPVHYVGSMDTKAARRTRSRREFLLSFDDDRDPVATTDATPQPVPEELKLAAIEAIWEHQAWREATWLGVPVARYPADLHSYQEVTSAVRPDVTVLLGDDLGLGGRALFLASVADQLGHGQVVAVGKAVDGTRPDHPRVTYIDAPADDPAARAEVGGMVGDGTALVIIGLGAVQRVTAAFASYAPLVPVGGYVVVENTVVNGRPAASSFGPGPHEAVSALLRLHPEFVPDVAYERHTVTFNKNGYLRRTAPT